MSDRKTINVTKSVNSDLPRADRRLHWINGLQHVLLFSLGCVGGLTTVKGSVEPASPRQVIDLNGTWQVEQGEMDTVPAKFTHTVPVPGLLDMAQPPFREVGKVSRERQAFWYRRTFKVDGAVPEVALLKIHKARYGTKVVLDGQKVGEHLPCFTPAYFDLKPLLQRATSEHELIIRVGANPECLPSDMPRGWDFEKYLYQPGLYDSVELILTGAPFIKNVQVAPDIVAGTVRALVEVEAGSCAVEASIASEIHEARSGKSASRGNDSTGVLPLAARQVGDRRPASRDPARAASGPRGSLPLRVEADDRKRCGHGPVRDAVVSVRPQDRPGAAQRQAVFHEGNQRLHRSLLRGRRSGREALAVRVGAAIAPAVQVDALELDQVLHRVSARLLVRHRRRGRIPDPGRVSDLVAGSAVTQESAHRSSPRRKRSSHSTSIGCASDGTTLAWSSGMGRTRA